MHLRTAAAILALCVVPASAVFAQDWEPRRGSGRDGVHIRIARSYHLPADQVAPSPVVVIAASATIEGRMEDDLVVIGGRLRIGPTAVVRGEITAIGGEVEVADGARIGRINDVSMVWPELRWAWRDWRWSVDQWWLAVLGLIGTAFRLALTMAAASVVALVAPRWVQAVQSRAGDAPLASGVVGFLAQLLFVPVLITVVIGLVITILGIPLLMLVPFAVLAFAVLWLGGFAGVAAQIGRGLRRRAGGAESPALDAAFGVWMIGALTLVGQAVALVPFFGPVAWACTGAGLFLEYLAWTVGLGAALTAPLRNRWSSPPPIPHTSPAL